jgi:hypothetical protein
MRVAAFVSLLLWASAASAQEPALDPANVLSWPRAPINRFGCMLEQSFGAQSQRFGCAQASYVNRGNPCTAADAYYEGPRLPADLATRVSPLLQSIDVKYEAGKVQAVTLFLKTRQTETAIRAVFALPPSGAVLPSNITNIDIDGCRADGPTQICNIVLIEGFDHQGAGDGACGEESAPPDPTPDGSGPKVE